jgi:translation elongation factor EF-4
VSIPKKLLFIGLGILALGVVVLTLGPLQSPALWQAFQCGYDLGINNSSLTQERISKYYNNNQILTIENKEESAGLATVVFELFS